MSNTNEQSINFYKKFQEIKYDMSKASLEDVKNIYNLVSMRDMVFIHD